jgi:predicted aconitase with swiveling domain
MCRIGRNRPGRAWWPVVSDLRYEVLYPGSARGPVLLLTEPLSLWGGLDPETGVIIDHSHPQLGVSVTDTIMVLDHGRGSSSSSSVLAEAIRLGTGPAGIILSEVDSIIVAGAFVAGHLYGRFCPVLCGPVPRAGGAEIDEMGKLTSYDI